MKLYNFIISAISENPGPLVLYTLIISLGNLFFYFSQRETQNKRYSKINEEINFIKSKLPISHLPNDEFSKADKKAKQKRIKFILTGSITLIILSAILTLLITLLLFFSR